MPKINVYLPDDLAEAVKDAGVPVSAVCQRALEQAVRRVTSTRELSASPVRDLPTDTPALSFTARSLRILHAAEAAAAAGGLPQTDGEHLLRALFDDRDSMAVRVLGALDITARQVRAELDRRTQGAVSGAPLLTGGFGKMSADLARVFELAANESSALGNGYIGTEHLLLGLIGEPEGLGGQALRALGADLRVTRRTVAAALIGWGSHAEFAARQLQPTDSQADLVAMAIRAELAPVLARIERLESQLRRGGD
jgi:ATP-dependent Clp protease ATP-binding subunit ClpC